MAKRSKTSPSGEREQVATALERLIKESKYKDALDFLNTLAAPLRNEIRIRQLEGLALARFGHLEEAQDVLGRLHGEGHLDAETLGIYARTWMDRYDKTGSKDHLRRSRDLYAEAFQRSPKDYYTGINAAAKSVFLGEETVAGGFAGQVEKLVGTRPKRGDYWITATAAEAQLLRRHYDRAARLYRAAVVDTPNERGSHDSTRLQA